ncbi:metal regulatory transcription factor 1 [Stylonychia lemnae]|uniref:Metal regulatory transcription factor 1 n=1 Tax=Stylonychia lemnae TaxID=5949 RepID=A0A078AD13_STYLE|nr:metal regulatory transcription factor 1 [Stylonychia lemnae]|eukprot:CDW80114.1 metal regulatory transcription factor 1 [Stylonychia lemnae]
MSERIPRDWKSQDSLEDSCTFEGCQQEFITKGHLKTHENINSWDKPFACEKCDKIYSRSESLRIHMKTHVISTTQIQTEEKPFVCTFNKCDQNLYREWQPQNSSGSTQGKSHIFALSRIATSHPYLRSSCRSHKGNNEPKKKRNIKNEDKAKIKTQKENKVDSPVMIEPEKIDIKLDKNSRQIHKNLNQQKFEKQQYQMQQQSEMIQSQQSIYQKQQQHISKQIQNYSINYLAQQPQIVYQFEILDRLHLTNPQLLIIFLNNQA